jgi:alpha-tubulin suppressor-like RCC1 family protein
MGKNLTRESFFTDSTWVCPGGVTQVRLLTYANLGQQIGGSHAEDVDGALYAWGRNDLGQLGDGTVTPKSSPVIVVGFTFGRFLQISANTTSAAAVDNQGDGYAWGENSKGQVGDISTVAKSSPVLIAGSYKWRSISASWSRAIPSSRWTWPTAGT